MPESAGADAKGAALRRAGVLHAGAGRVSDENFRVGGFFDARDLVQVKYEMLRRTEEGGWSAAKAARTFALSRPTFYKAYEAFTEEGVLGLLPRKRGPRSRHKLTEKIVTFARGLAAEKDAPSSKELARQIRSRFGVRVHPRSIERALARPEKKRK
jgi:transposase